MLTGAASLFNNLCGMPLCVNVKMYYIFLFFTLLKKKKKLCQLTLIEIKSLKMSLFSVECD